MKKIVKLLLLLVFPIVSLSSCKKEDDLILISTTYKANSCIELTNEEFNYKKDNLDNFILFVYASGCSTCSYFETNVLNKYIIDNNVDFYKIDYEQYNEKILKKYETNPKLVIYKEGEIFNIISAKQDENIFNYYENLSFYLSKYIAISNMQIVNNYTDLDELVTDNVIYYGWNKCSDCSYFEEHYLTKYLLNPYKIFYYFECDQYRKYKNTENNQIWLDFINKYQININDNTGVVPTIIKYENNIRVDYVTFFNDTLDNNDGILTIINTQYGNKESIIGLSFSSYLAYQNGVAEYHFNKVDIFMNKYLK